MTVFHSLNMRPNLLFDTQKYRCGIGVINLNVDSLVLLLFNLFGLVKFLLGNFF